MDTYSGPKLVKFKCIFKFDDNSEWPEKEMEKKGDMLIKEFRNELMRCENLHGDVTFKHSGQEVRDPLRCLGNVVRSGDTLHVYCDKSVKVAMGGTTQPSFATAGNSLQAVARGGVASGGSSHSDGTMRGGHAFGGDATGNIGQGGNAFGGRANNTDGPAESGNAFAGDFAQK